MLKKLGQVSGFTLLSRVLGLVRDLCFAAFFGAGGALDAFLVAFKIPNFFRRIFAEGALTQALLPSIAHADAEGGHSKSNLISGVAFYLLCILIVLTLWVCFYPESLISIFAPGFRSNPEKFLLASQLLAIIFPYLGLISLTALLAAILNYNNYFAASAFNPALLNISFIVFCFLGLSWFEPPIMALAWAALLGGVAQFLFLRVSANSVLTAFLWQGWRHKREAFDVLKLMVPALFGIMIVQINLMVDMFLASFLRDGSLSWLYYADRLVEFPVGIFGVALSTVLAPQLSRHAANSDQAQFLREIAWGIKLAVLIAVPAVFGLMMVGPDAIKILFERGAFTSEDSRLTYYALLAYAVGMPAFILIKIYAGAFYAQKKMRIPVKAAALSCVTNIVLNLILIQFLEYAGLALATSIAAWVNVIYLHRNLKDVEGVFSKKEFITLLIANTALIVVVLFYFLMSEAPSHGLLQISYLLVGIFLGMLAYAVSIYYSNRALLTYCLRRVSGVI